MPSENMKLMQSVRLSMLFLLLYHSFLKGWTFCMEIHRSCKNGPTFLLSPKCVKVVSKKICEIRTVWRFNIELLSLSHWIHFFYQSLFIWFIELLLFNHQNFYLLINIQIVAPAHLALVQCLLYTNHISFKKIFIMITSALSYY